MKRRDFLKLICASPLAGLVKADESVKPPEYMGPRYYMNLIFEPCPIFYQGFHIGSVPLAHLKDMEWHASNDGGLFCIGAFAEYKVMGRGPKEPDANSLLDYKYLRICYYDPEPHFSDNYLDMGIIRCLRESGWRRTIQDDEYIM